MTIDEILTLELGDEVFVRVWRSNNIYNIDFDKLLKLYRDWYQVRDVCYLMQCTFIKVYTNSVELRISDKLSKSNDKSIFAYCIDIHNWSQTMERVIIKHEYDTK